ncbi:MAG: hypothetical protein KDB22_26910 [Planctomycetales bacterium]|nr:hypothetical protein [Planctomycetales bacterium]
MLMQRVKADAGAVSWLSFNPGKLLILMLMLLCVHSSIYESQGQENSPPDAVPERNYLFVACPGIRNYLEYGGHGLLVYDIDDNHRFLRRIPLAGVAEDGRPINVKGICGNAQTGRIFVSTIRTLQCVDMHTESILWEKTYEGGLDRMSISPDGKFIYQPSFEGPDWYVLDGINGDVMATLSPGSGAHNTIVGLDGKYAYLAGLKSPILSIADTSVHQLTKQVGPFSNSIRPFTVDGKQHRCYVCVNELLGFEIGDIRSGRMLHRIEVQGFSPGKVKRHGCPSHGVGLTPDEKEIWVVDAFNRRIHIFDNTVDPPEQRESIALRDEPGWVTFSIDGRWAYPSTGQIIDTASKRIVAQLTDEHGTAVASEKILQVVFQNGKAIRTGDQFGLGRVR